MKMIEHLFQNIIPQTKDFNVLIDGKSFFDVPVKKKEETHNKIIEISKNNNYTSSNLLDYEYFSDITN